MKKIKFLILWLVLSIIWLTSFSSAWLESWIFTVPFNESHYSVDLPYNWNSSSFICFPNYTSLYYIYIESTNWLFYYSFQPTSDSQFWFDSNGLCLKFPDSSYSYEFEISKATSESSSSISLTQYYFEETPSTPTCNTWSCNVSSYQDIVYSWSKVITQNSTTNIIDFWSSPNKTMCITLNWTMWNQNYVKLWFNNNATSVASDSQEYWYDQVGKTVCLYANKRYFNINNPKSTNPELTYSIYFLNDLLSESVPCNETINDCSTIELELSSCQWDLSSCEDDNESLSNMNQSLSSELESCLESWWWGCNPEVDTGCVEGAIVPLLSWSVWLDSFTTPIINNLTLPTNYKWKIDDWVLTIASINSNLSIDDSDYWNIKSVFISVVLYTFGLGLMLILVYYIKFYFFNIKDK